MADDKTGWGGGMFMLLEGYRLSLSHFLIEGQYNYRYQAVVHWIVSTPSIIIIIIIIIIIV